MKYDYQISSHRKKKFFKKIYFLVAGILILSGLLVLIIRIDVRFHESSNTEEDTTTDKSTAYFAPSTKIFRTEYFQFQTNNSWSEIPSESDKSKYVYRSIHSSLIEHELTVYVDDIPNNLTATRVLPVKISNEGRFTTKGISGHCNEAVGGFKTDRQTVSYKGVTVDCDVDNTQYNVLVGLIGGSTKLTLTRPDGNSAGYTIYYKNVKALPGAAELISIVDSFQTR